MQTKETQTPKAFFKDKAVLKKEVMQSKGTQYVQKAYKDENVQCNIDSSTSKEASIMEETLDDSVISENDLDSSYRISDNSESDENDVPRTTTIKSHSTGYVVYWSCISILFLWMLSKCFKRLYGGSMLIIELLCYKGHKNIWRSQQVINGYALGDLRLVASILYSANIYAKLEAFFKLANIPFLCKTSYYSIQKKFLFGVINEAWLSEKTILFSGIKKKTACSLSGDRRCDSSGDCVKYMTYSILDQASNKVIDMEICQSTQAENSNRMEKFAFVKLLNGLKNVNIKIEILTTDRHCQIRKHMQEEEQNIDHQFDVWHFRKNIKQKLNTVSKKASCNDFAHG